MEVVRVRLPGEVCLLEYCWPLPPHAADSSSSPLHRYQVTKQLVTQSCRHSLRNTFIGPPIFSLIGTFPPCTYSESKVIRLRWYNDRLLANHSDDPSWMLGQV
jgi:hypothetical protein